jgi:starch synthase
MKAALALSDRLVTVSPTYAAEIRTLEYGAGFDGLLRFRRRVLHGILNGIDTSVWQPATDRAIAATYSVVNVEPRQQNRAALLEETGLEDGGPIFGMVSRLAHQKGIDLLIDALPRLVDAGARVAVIGSGDPASEQALLRASSGWPGRVSVFIGFDDARARRLYAGADFFLMPSRYEPCGLGQMIAQRYGTPPVVRATGGLVDTVEDGKTGFTFADATPEALADAVERAMRSWQARGWVTLQRRCMRLDWSWARSAERYEQVYRLAIGALPG